jgi:hypothetical protein
MPGWPGPLDGGNCSGRFLRRRWGGQHGSGTFGSEQSRRRKVSPSVASGQIPASTGTEDASTARWSTLAPGRSSCGVWSGLERRGTACPWRRGSARAEARQRRVWGSCGAALVVGDGFKGGAGR